MRQVAVNVSGEQIVTQTYLRALSREFDARLFRTLGGKRKPVPPSPKSIAALPWNFHTVPFHHAMTTRPFEFLPGFSIKSYGGHSHPNQWGDGAHSAGYVDDNTEPKVLKYRQLYEGGKPVPLAQQAREYKYQPPAKKTFGKK